MNDEDYLKQLVEKTKGKYQAQRQADVRAHHVHEAKTMGGSKFYSELRSWLEWLTENINKEISGAPIINILDSPTKETFQLESILSSAKTRTKVTVKYTDKTHSLRWVEVGATSKGHEFLFNLNGDDEIVAVSSEDGKGRSAADVGQQIVDYLTN